MNRREAKEVLNTLSGQKKKVFAYILEKGSITTIEGAQMWIADTRAVVRDLRNMGVPIEARVKTSPNGARYHEWYLKKGA